MRFLQLTSCLLAVPATLAVIKASAAGLLAWTYPALVASSLVFHSAPTQHMNARVKAVDMALAHAVVLQHMYACLSLQRFVVRRPDARWAVYLATTYGLCSFYVARRHPSLQQSDLLHGIMHAVMATGSTWFLAHLV